jgi:hypothetical protein
VSISQGAHDGMVLPAAVFLQDYSSLRRNKEAFTTDPEIPVS